jgi:hypothetical protein
MEPKRRKKRCFLAGSRALCRQKRSKSFFNPAQGTSSTRPKLTKAGRHAAALFPIDATQKHRPSQAPAAYCWRRALTPDCTPRLKKSPKRPAAGWDPSRMESPAKSRRLLPHQSLFEFVRGMMPSPVPPGRVSRRTPSTWADRDWLINIRFATLIAR